MTTHYSYNEFHIGDQILHLHFLRKLALRYPQHRFEHFMHVCYLDQLRDVVKDIPTIRIGAIESGGIRFLNAHPEARNVWKNADGYWESHPLKNDFSRFYLRWFDKLAKEMGLESPLKTERDLLFDYPALLEPAWPGETFDYLVINSRPCSGQFLAYDRVEYFDPLLNNLVEAGKRVVATQQSDVAGVRYTPDSRFCQPLTITQIGNLALRCKNIVGVATGPMWPTYSVWAKPEKRVVCLGNGERLNLDGEVQCANLAEVFKELGL